MSLSLVATAAFASSLVATVPADVPDLLQFADPSAALARADARPLSADSLATLSKETSVRVATTWFADRLLAEPGVAVAHERIAGSADALRLAPDDPGVWTVPPDAWTVLLVPGSETGALGTQGLAQHRLAFTDAGFSVRVHDAPPAATDDVQRLQEHVRSLSAEGARVLLVTADAGSVLASEALDGLDAPERGGVRGWIGLNGPAPQAPVPDGVQRVQLIAVPQRADLPVRDRRAHRQLSPDGPNDGATLLADQLVPGALVVPVPGVAPAELALHTAGAAALMLDGAADASIEGTVSLRGGATTTP